MADQDKASKTEEATPKRVADAAKKGDFPKSQEFKNWIFLFAGALLLLTYGDIFGNGLRSLLTGYVANLGQVEVTGPGITQTMTDLGYEVLQLMLLPISVFVIVAILGTTLQHKPSLTLEKIKPELKKINPVEGFKKKFSTQNLVDFLKTVAKFLIVFTAVAIILWPDRELLPVLMATSIPQILDTLMMLILKILLTIVAIMTLLAAVDMAYQRYEHAQKLKMTKQEVKDERKQLDGDPQIKARLRQIRSERARRRMMAAVPDADVVITNPTHYACALKYDHGKMAAPILLAKGVDEVAARIRDVADDHDIPLVENPPLARALYASVDIDQEIPPEHYRAVAEVIGFVLGLRDGRISGQRAESHL